MADHRKIAAFILILMVSLVYGNSIWNDYSGDDGIFISENKITSEGLKRVSEIFSDDGVMNGWLEFNNTSLEENGFRKRYRPLAQFTFAAEVQFFGQNPHISHLINVLLFALTILLIYFIFLYFFRKFENQKWYFSTPFVLTLLFIAHPIHTEVVANIKSRDEILALLFSLLGLFLTIRFLNSNKTKYLLYSGISFFLALLSKENAITFLAIVPLFTFYIIQKQSEKATRSKLPYLKVMLPFALSGLAYLLISYLVLKGNNPNWDGNLHNNYFGNLSLNEKYGTIVYSLGKYIQLLVFPIKLLCDYSVYEIPITKLTSCLPIILSLLFISLIVFALVNLTNKNIYAFCILFFAITISVYSNLLFSTGTAVAERFLYIPSLGYCILIAYLLTESVPSFLNNFKFKYAIPVTFTVALLLFFSIKTIARNTEWKNDDSIVAADVKKINNCARLNYSYAVAIFDGEKKKAATCSPEKIDSAKYYYLKAIKIFPKYTQALNILATCYYYKNDYDSAIFYYIRSIHILRNQKNIYSNISAILDKKGDPAYSLLIYNELYKIEPNIPVLNYKIGMLYKDAGKKDSAIFYLKHAVELNRNYKKATQELEKIYTQKDTSTQY